MASIVLKEGDVVWHNNKKLGVIEKVLEKNEKMVQLRLTTDDGLIHDTTELTHRKSLSKVN